jgi:hypothetical protein
MRRSSLAWLLLLALVPSLAGATAMTEPGRRSFSVAFDNGDRLAIDCDEEQCVLSLLVNGQRFRFDRADLGVRDIYPDEARLYSGFASGRDQYFSFDVSVACPEEVQPHFYSCSANALVQEGKPLEVDIHRFHPPERYAFDPEAPPTPMSWEYTLLSPAKDKLERLLPILAAMGYESQFGIGEYVGPKSSRRGQWELVVRRNEGYTPALLAQRKREFTDLAATHGVEFHAVLVE